MVNQNSPQIFHFLSASFGYYIICLRLQIYMNHYCGPISAANLWVGLDKWEVSVVKTREDDPLLIKRNISLAIFCFWDECRMYETVTSSFSYKFTSFPLLKGSEISKRHVANLHKSACVPSCLTWRLKYKL